VPDRQSSKYSCFFEVNTVVRQLVHMTLALQKFDPLRMKDASVIVAVGKRNTGKSELIKDLMYYKRHVPAGVVCSGSEDGNSFYQNIVPGAFVYNHFNKAAIERLIEQQRKAKKAGRCHPVFLVLDDLMFDRSFLNDKLLRYLFMNGRHFNICLFMTTQYAVDIPIGMRSNIDYVFVLRDNLYREKLWRNLFMIFPSLEKFNAAMDVCTEFYGALVLDNTVASTTLTDCVFWYKAKVGRNYRMGSEAFWEFARKHSAKHERESQDDSTTIDGTKKNCVRPSSAVVKKVMKLG